MLQNLFTQDFGGELQPTVTSFNYVDPFGDAGSLVTMFDPQNLFPVIMVLVLFGGFVIAWILSLVIDRRNAASMEALHREHVLLFGEVLPGFGKEEVRGTSLDVCLHLRWYFFLCEPLVPRSLAPAYLPVVSMLNYPLVCNIA